MPASQRLAQLRASMQQHQLAAYIVLTADPHLSEYLPARWQSRQWLTGFTGSVGTLVVTASGAGLWVDSRYWEQAAAQLEGTGVVLMKSGHADVPEPADWVAKHVHAPGRVGVDASVLSLALWRKLSGPLAEQEIELVTDLDLVQAIWTDRPGLPDAPVFAHQAPYATVSRADKLTQVRADVRALGADVHLISTLDDIAWLTNLRGSDVSYNPVFLAHMVLTHDAATLYVPNGKVSDDVVQDLIRDGVDVAPYETLGAGLARITPDQKVLIDPARMTKGVLAHLDARVELVEAYNPSSLRKACKTPEELAHVRQAMEHDGAALCDFFAWFESRLGQQPMTELTVDVELTARRKQRPGFVSLSFPTIAGFNGNGAMPHYRATEAAYADIEGDGLLLIDSGAQYVGGTTDITRVIPIGSPSDAQKRDFTLVLKGMIRLSMAQFPVGLPAPMLDALARAPIWAAGADFGHGTGHGVGYFLNVHEGPQVIAHRAAALPHTAMRAGMITSNEPGIYRDGRWGVRIENLVANVAGDTTELGEFLKFETLTLCPIDTRCIVGSLLEPAERTWLNAYHAEVERRLSPLVQGDTLAWLQARCQPMLNT